MAGGGTKKSGPSRNALLGIIGGVVAAIIAILLITAFWIPGWAPKTLSQTAAQDGVKTVLNDKYGITNVEKVECPADQKVDEGSSFTCKVTVGGQEQTVTLTFTDGDGTYTVSRPTS